MASTIHVSGAKDGLTVKAYRGAGAAMLAFDLDAHIAQDLAGFSVSRLNPGDATPAFLPNRISFSTAFTASTTAKQRVWTSSYDAPFQKFRWIDVPPDVVPGTYTFTVIARLFADRTTNPPVLKDGPTVSVSLDLTQDDYSNFRFGFTRGYMSSQAYNDKFHDANGRPLDYRPSPKSLDYPYNDYLPQYVWLGFEARKLLFDFVQECVDDTSCSVDMFAYDLDEPEFLRLMQSLGPRLRAYLDNAPLHTGASALEPEAKTRLEASAGADHVKTGHFSRFAHNKVLIKRDNSGKAVKVLTGSANFSVRGMYVQANNILVFDDPAVAGLYEQAFNQAFTDASGFSASPISQHWYDVAQTGLPPFAVSFSPHANFSISLDKIDKAIQSASSSVLYAVMQFGSGPVMDDLTALGSKDNIFSYGMTQSSKGVDIYKPGSSNGELVPFAYLNAQVPPPFTKEFSGGMGQVIHDKFIVIDFNDNTPIVFTGSSNLAGGGEKANGDNLLAISDVAVATAYAVEAIRMIDHFHFRLAMQNATKVDPLSLSVQDWWQPYYNPTDIKCRERSLFTR